MKNLAIAYNMKKKMAAGGEVDASQPTDDEKAEASLSSDMVSGIMAKRYSKGGMIANDVGVAEADKLPAEYDDLVLRDDLESTQKDFGDELGNEREEKDRKDMVSLIMKKRSDKNPKPA